MNEIDDFFYRLCQKILVGILIGGLIPTGAAKNPIEEHQNAQSDTTSHEEDDNAGTCT